MQLIQISKRNPGKQGLNAPKIIAGLLLVSSLFSLSCQRAGKPVREAGRILKKSGVEGGLVVHYQCGDARMTAALKGDDRYTVQGLDRDRDDIALARTHIRSAGLDATVSVMHWEEPFLPYTDLLVNLFIAEEEPDIPMQEILRVLVPGGVAMINGKKTVKPWPPGMDEWNQTRYDQTNNGVSKDSVGPPRYLRWTAGPLHARSHEENSSTMAVITANGRMFYIQDEGLIGVSDGRLPSMWKLVARDGFNGRLLWKHPIPEWGWQVWEQKKREEIWPTRMAGRHQFPAGMARRLIAHGDRVYMTLGYRAPVSVIDAASGKILRTLEQTGNTDEILLVENKLIVLQREVPAGDRNQKVELSDNPSRIQAIDPETGKTLWSVSSGFAWQWSMISDGKAVFFFDADNESVRSVDLNTGAMQWQASLALEEVRSTQYIGLTFIVSDGKLIYMGPDHIESFDAETGKALWSMKGKGGSAPVSHNQPSMFVADGVLWLGGPGGSSNGDQLTGYDPGTGREVRTLEPGFLLNKGHHYRCYPPRATENYVIFPRRGAEFMDLEGKDNLRHDWLRGACRFGFIPSNGLFYVTPHQCYCYRGVLINGFNAFASVIEKSDDTSGSREKRIQRGPAYRKALAAGEYTGMDEPWPMYRHDNARSGNAGVAIPTELVRLWKVKLGSELKQPTIAGGNLYITDASTNRIVCLEERTGRQSWEFTADAEVDSPPTFFKGLLLFGCTDGWIYCLDAASGDLAWKYRVAPAERFIMDEGRLQSAWPVHGSVLVLDDKVYASAGRSSFHDGGIYLAGVDVYSGEPVHRGHFEGPYAETTEKVKEGHAIEGAINDLLVTDGQYIYLRQNKFDRELNHIPIKPLERVSEQPVKRGKYDVSIGDKKVGLHLFATGGFLDDSFWNRNFWMHSEIWPGFYYANQAPKAGQLITFDEMNTYAVKHYPRRNPHSPMNIPGKDGYLVFADRTDAPVNLYLGNDDTKPLEWLPTSMKALKGGKLMAEEDPNYPAVNFDKGPGLSRITPPLWTAWHPTRFIAMSQAGDKLVLSGVPDEMPEDDPMAAFEGRLGSRLVILEAVSGKTLAVFELDAVPVFDGISIGNDRIYLVSRGGEILCLGSEKES